MVEAAVGGSDSLRARVEVAMLCSRIDKRPEDWAPTAVLSYRRAISGVRLAILHAASKEMKPTGKAE